ncbi:GTP-binding protein Rho1, partial [Physocladia obscura]
MIGESPSYDVMLSYCWDNKMIVVNMHKVLVDSGLRVWIDEEDMTGSTAKAMQEAIKASAVIVPVLSKEYVHSFNAMKELKYSDQLHKKIVPVRLDTSDVLDDSEAGFITTGLLCELHAYTDSFRRLWKSLSRIRRNLPNTPVPASVVRRPVGDDDLRKAALALYESTIAGLGDSIPATPHTADLAVATIIQKLSVAAIENKVGELVTSELHGTGDNGPLTAKNTVQTSPTATSFSTNGLATAGVSAKLAARPVVGQNILQHFNKSKSHESFKTPTIKSAMSPSFKRGHSDNLQTIRRKVVLVGDGASGKTCTLVIFVTGRFPEAYVPTVFENFLADVQTLDPTDGHNKNVLLALWDTAGQEEYSRLRPLSYPEAHAAIIMFGIDSPDSFKNCYEDWLNEIFHFIKPPFPVFLVGNKVDLRNDTRVIQELRKLG